MIITLNNNRKLIERVSNALRDGQIITLPTDTVYGFAVDGQNRKAINALVSIKGRDKKPFTFFMTKRKIQQYTLIAHELIIDEFMPGALTVILKKKEDIDVPRIDETIGIRIPNTPFILNLLEHYDSPLAVTSANRSGEQPCTTAYEIAEKFTGIFLILNEGTLISQPSTVIDCTRTPPVIRRKGRILIIEIERVYGDLISISAGIKFNVLFVCTGNSCRSPMAEAILKTLVNSDYCEVKSAGILPVGGMPPSRHAQTIVEEYNGSLADHQSKTLTPAMIMWADVIFAMGRKHVDYIRQLSPTAQNKVFLLKTYVKKMRGKEIADPVGRDLKAYRRTAQEMYPALRAIARDINQRYRGNA